MNILFIGDIFASPGRRIVADHVQDIIETNHIDLAIANAENAAGGFGITPAIAEELRSEEHTSELQSLRHLVCRLLLEKTMTQSVAYPTNTTRPAVTPFTHTIVST